MRFKLATRIQINRAELSGAFGDIGTDLPLLTGMILAAGLHPVTVLVVFGLAQIGSALFYGIPMPVQPLKAVAALVIAGGITASQLQGAGLSIGLIMLLLTATGLLDRLRAIIPKSVIRGIQLGLGVKLFLLACSRYIPSDGLAGLMLAGACGLLILLLLKRRVRAPAIPVVGIGLAYAFLLNSGAAIPPRVLGLSWPGFVNFTTADMVTGAILLALPQIPLSLGNSLFSTHQMASDLFPARRVSVRTIGYTYSVLNILSSLIGGIPVCHGSGGMAGHYVFGGRSGGSVLIYGVALVSCGLFFGSGLGRMVLLFPLPVLGVLLATEGIALTRFVRDVIPNRQHLTIAVSTAVCAVLLPYGFLIGMVVGTLMARISSCRGCVLPIATTTLARESADV